jgi:hypothetical protein
MGLEHLGVYIHCHGSPTIYSGAGKSQCFYLRNREQSLIVQNSTARDYTHGASMPINLAFPVRVLELNQGVSLTCLGCSL